MTRTIETLHGEVHIDDLPNSRNKAVTVVGALTAEHALSIASEAVTEVGLGDGEWGRGQRRKDGSYLLILEPPDAEITCEGFGPQ